MISVQVVRRGEMTEVTSHAVRKAAGSGRNGQQRQRVVHWIWQVHEYRRSAGLSSIAYFGSPTSHTTSANLLARFPAAARLGGGVAGAQRLQNLVSIAVADAELGNPCSIPMRQSLGGKGDTGW